MKNEKARAGRILALILALCMICIVSFPVMAEGELTVTDDPRESIMMITVGYQDDNGVYMDYQAGTCFLINDEYVLTNKHVVALSTTEDTDGDGKIDFEAFREWAKDNFSNVKDDMLATDGHIKIKVYVNRDMMVDATMHSSVNSDDLDFAAVKLSEKIYDRKPIAMGDSDALEAKATVYAYGFPADSIRTIEYNTKDDVSIMSGTVSKVAVISDQAGVRARNVDAIEHSATLNRGNSGGPLLDENNSVVGVNSYGSATKNYSVQINVIKRALDTFGIPYVEGNASGSISPAELMEPIDSMGSGEPDDEPDNTAILAELRSALTDAKSIDVAVYTEKSVEALDDSIGRAEAILGESNAEAARIQSVTDDLNDAINGLEEKPKTNFLLIGGIAAVAVVAIVVVIIVVIISGNKRKKAEAERNRLVSGAQGGFGGTDTVPAASQNGYGQGTMPNVQTMPEGAGETTLLNAGAGETTLLGGGGSAYLIRKKNGEKIMLNVQNFKIGKERRRVNYCISDNTSVSRVHCEIVRKGADYYVADQGSTNFTFVNGVQCSPRMETLLSDQSILKLSDEEFEFHLS